MSVSLLSPCHYQPINITNILYYNTNVLVKHAGFGKTQSFGERSLIHVHLFILAYENTLLAIALIKDALQPLEHHIPQIIVQPI